MKLKSVLCLCLCMLIGCSEKGSSEDLTKASGSIYRTIGVVVPRHYDVWIDKFYIESLSKNIGWRRNFGSVSCCWKSMPLAGTEWQTTPEVFYIRWFSFAEQQTYQALIKLENADAIAEKMKAPVPFESFGKVAIRPRDALVIGLAPGGTIVFWIMNTGENAIEVARYKADPFSDNTSDYSQWTKEYLKREADYLAQNGLRKDEW